MNYIGVPIAFSGETGGQTPVRDKGDVTEMLDNLIELIVFTPRGSFAADPDFGFEYWNHEYSNIRYRSFNSGQSGPSSASIFSEITRKECQDSVKESLSAYGPQLRQVDVQIEIEASDGKLQRKKVKSKYIVRVTVTGTVNDGLGVGKAYRKEVIFLAEPTARRMNRI